MRRCTTCWITLSVCSPTSLKRFRPGEWLSDCYLDHDGRGESTHRYALRLKKDDSGLTFDYTETDPQIPAFINCAYAGLFSATYIGVLVYLCADIPWNSGVMRRVRILSNEGSLNNARFPAAVSGSLELIWNSTNAACAALGKMLCASEQQRSSAMAVWQGSTCRLHAVRNEPVWRALRQLDDLIEPWRWRARAALATVTTFPGL